MRALYVRLEGFPHLCGAVFPGDSCQTEQLCTVGMAGRSRKFHHRTWEQRLGEPESVAFGVYGPGLSSASSLSGCLVWGKSLNLGASVCLSLQWGFSELHCGL